MNTVEHCQLCDEHTNHAGEGEDSIFIATARARIGPLCALCADEIRQWALADCGYDIGQVEKILNTPGGLSGRIEALKAALATAVQAEGERCRTEEVKPAIRACNLLILQFGHMAAYSESAATVIKKAEELRDQAAAKALQIRVAGKGPDQQQVAEKLPGFADLIGLSRGRRER